MIRVLHVLGGLERGGAETMVMNLYRKIDKSEIQFDFIVHTETKDAYYDEIISLGGKIYHCPKYKGKNHFAYKKWWKTFFQSHSEYKILHSHVRSCASIYISVAKKCGIKTIIHSHSTSNGNGIVSVIKRVMQFPLRFQADYLMACSNEAAQWLYGKNVCQKSNYIFFPNAIDTEKYCFSEETSLTYRKKFELQEKFVIGHVGRFHEAKNHLFLLDIFADIYKKRSDAMLLLIGDGELREAIEKKIRVLNLEKQVVLTGSRNDVPQLLQAMDVFVFPSAWEGLPVTVVEAQAAGLPCFISDNITKEVDLSELVSRLPITDANLWADTILKSDLKRLDVIQNIEQASFDVNNTAIKLTEFYRSL